ncbi:MAG: hypothetical protein ACTSQ0_06270 [Candidatus Heimdallarchaeota archaeon]
MATATTIGRLLKNAKLGQAGLALTAAQAGKDELKAFSLREYNYDFVGFHCLVIRFQLVPNFLNS